MSAQPAGWARGKRIISRGCLQQSGADLYLTQDDGKQVGVTGAKPDEYSGHEVEVSGERSRESDRDIRIWCGVQCGAASGNQSQKRQRLGSQLEQDIPLNLSIHFCWCLRRRAI